MKKYSFNLDLRLTDEAFRPIRSQQGAIETLMQCIKRMLVGDLVPDDRKCAELELRVTRSSRLFIFMEGKFVSFGFPFSVTEDDFGLSFHSRLGHAVDSKVTSEVIGVLSALDPQQSPEVMDFAETICGSESLTSSLWPTLFELLTYEFGYVRYDHDSNNEDGDIHPLHHYDFFYSSSITCKIGLRERINREDMIELLSPDNECRYIERKRI